MAKDLAASVNISNTDFNMSLKIDYSFTRALPDDSRTASGT